MQGGAVLALTGATGYVGRALVQRLRACDLPFLTLGRRPAAQDTQHRMLDLSQPSGFRASLEGVSTLLHLAGVAHNAGDRDSYRQVNVRAVLALADAAVSSGCRRLIFVSSLNVVPPETSDAGLAAQHFPQPVDAYADSKWRAEQQLEAILAGSGVELMIVRPALLYDRELVANLAMLQSRLRRWPLSLPALGSRSLVARPDLVNLLVSLLQQPWQSSAEHSSGVQRIAVTDGQCYDLARISRALRNGAAVGSVPVPAACVWLMARYLDWSQRLDSGTSWRGLAGDKWVSEQACPSGHEPQWRLESLLATAR